MEDIRRKGWEKRPAGHTSNELSSRERAYYPRADDHTTSHRKDVQGDYRNARAGGSMSYYREVSRPSSGVDAQHRFNRDKPRLLDSIAESSHLISHTNMEWRLRTSSRFLMVFRNWDPGSQWEGGDFDWASMVGKFWGKDKSSLDKDLISKGKIGLSGYGASERDGDRSYFGEIRFRESQAEDRDGVDRISIAILFMWRSSDFPGISSNHSLQRNVISHMEIEEIIYGLDTIGIWYLWISWVCEKKILRKTWKGKHNYGFNCVIFGLNEGKYGCRESGNSDQYKNHRRSFI
ncbi:hypothetical protein HID58_043011 [Brassica napus]|uniref:Uncharacterized protein n=1 Tax=Brassica napus TaxID=3708 RepID=A0ABQ8BFJ0_BRANA|nr:hypothetical protein HID58_043011 [Brassica napus]